ncbi:MAG: hypothetical protein QM831_08530 [Kofleriaceae bacterium]
MSFGAGGIARWKNRSFGKYMLFGLLFPVVTLVVAICVQARNPFGLDDQHS